MADASIRVKAADGVWHVVGTEEGRGRWAEGLTMSSNQNGPDKCSFTLHRNPRLPWPDLPAFAPLDVEVDGVLLWGGRVSQSPFTIDAQDESISVEAEGSQYHMDDDNSWLSYLIGHVGDFQDQRSMPVFNPANFTQSPQVSVGDGIVNIGFPKGTALVVGECVGAVLDFGPNSAIKSVALVWSSSATAGYTVYLRASASPDFTNATSYADLVSGGGLPAPASTLTTGTSPWTTAGAGYRYLHIVIYSSAIQTPAADVWLKLHSIQVASNTAYIPAPSSNNLVSTLYASTVLNHWLSLGLVPLCSPDRTRIAATLTALPEYWQQGSTSTREVFQALNSYHDYLWGVDEQWRPFFQPRPSVPLYEVGDWSGWEFTDASSGSGQDIYNWVVVEGTGTDGQALYRAVNVACPPIDRYGFARTKTLQVSSVLTPAVADSMGLTWLTSNKRTPFRGSINAVGQGSVRTVLGGQHMHPAQMLLAPGQLMRLPLTDPDTGGWGRDVEIASVSYTHGTESAAITLDTDNARFEALLGRMALNEAALGIGG